MANLLKVTATLQSALSIKTAANSLKLELKRVSVNYKGMYHYTIVDQLLTTMKLVVKTTPHIRI